MAAVRSIRAAIVAVLLVVTAAIAVVAPPAGAQQPAAVDSPGPQLLQPPSQAAPPAGFVLSAREAVARASRAEAARDAAAEHPRALPRAYIAGPGLWEVDWLEGRRSVAQVDVDGRSGKVLHSYTGLQAWDYLARGHLGRLADSPWLWALLCAAFVAPFFDPRRPFRLLHLDLIALLGFGVSHLFFTQGNVELSAPLVYPVLAYLLVRMLVIAARPRHRREAIVPFAPTWLLAVALVALVGLRVGVNVANDKVIDVGYASVVGADRIVHRDQLYTDNEVHGDTYGPVSYLAYVPFEAVLPWTGRWDNLAAAHAGAIAFDLLTLLGLLLLGVRLRAGPEGRRLGLALAYAWAAYPYTQYALALNSNDALISLLLVLALLALASPAARGALLGLAAAAKFAPLALAPLFAAGQSRRDWRQVAAFSGALAGVIAVAVLAYLPDGGLREFWHATLGYQLERTSAFSPWGQHEGLGWLQLAAGGLAAAVALAVALLPRRRDAVQVAALAAAVLVAVQLPATHWFYFYLVWLAPFAFVAMLGSVRAPACEPVASEPVLAVEREPVLA